MIKQITPRRDFLSVQPHKRTNNENRRRLKMAVVETASYEREPGIKRICWGAIIAGALLALVLFFMLSVLGAAIGLTVLDPSKREPAEGLGIGALVWWLLCTVISIFIGGCTAAKLSAVWMKGNGMLHGIVTWALITVIMAWLVTSTAGAVMGGALSTLQAGMQAGAQAADEADQGTIQQLQQKAKELAGQAQQEAEQTTEQEKEQVAEKAANVSAAALWGTFIMLLIGLIAGALGGITGAACNKKLIEKGPYAAERERR